jgi:hypothetical protein
MDAEELRQLLSQVQMRCLILEADKEAEILRAAKYRNILGTFAGEDRPGATQPEAPRILHAARSTFARSTLPATNVCCPNLYHGYVFMLTWMASVIIGTRGATARPPSPRTPHGGQKAQFIVC